MSELSEPAVRWLMAHITGVHPSQHIASDGAAQARAVQAMVKQAVQKEVQQNVAVVKQEVPL